MSPRHTHYDMIFLGGGCAALSLLVRLVRSKEFSKARFLVIDRDRKNSNDRTWCFWEKGEGYFEEVVHRQWGQLDFFSNSFSSPLQLEGYRYKMIRGVDFYTYCLDVLERSGQVEWVEATLTDVSRANDSLILKGTPGSTALQEWRAPGESGYTFTWHLHASLVFNSLYKSAITSSGQVDLLQHFKGWVIELPETTAATQGGNLSFDTDRATLMDFRVSQREGATFVYVMPLSTRHALVEYTLFTPSLLSASDYEDGLRLYIKEYLGISDYRVVEQEFGIIPMTTRSFSFFEQGVFNLGTAGGQTKASSGYTFQFIQKQSEQIAARLSTINRDGKAGQDAQVWQSALLSLKADAGRFRFYDRVLLHVLAKGYWPGDQVFARLFARNKAETIFRFLDNESNLREELAIISSLPTGPFLKAALTAL
ncbi:MAG: lycopene cyclase family protein [Sphingomonadales bacterium]